jgi:hypothetical protein
LGDPLVSPKSPTNRSIHSTNFQSVRLIPRQ